MLFPWCPCDGCDVPGNFLCQLNGHMSCHVSPRQMGRICKYWQFGILVNLILCCLYGFCTWLWLRLTSIRRLLERRKENFIYGLIDSNKYGVVLNLLNLNL